MTHLASSLVSSLPRIRNARTGRTSSWDTSGRNDDVWHIAPGETRVLADIQGPGCITHLWLTQRSGYRNCLLRFTWDNAPFPSIVVPLGDFFGLGHGIVNSYQSALFTASTQHNLQYEKPCALNSYLPMPFKKRALVEFINEGTETQNQYFYVDYETYDAAPDDLGYAHAEFRRANPFGGWGMEIPVNTPEADIVNLGREAWDNNYVLLDTKGRGHYIGCNISVSNLQGTWWGEGDDMIWVDGYKWPPDLHGTGSEDYLNQAWGMQPNAFARNGTTVFEWHFHGYQCSYVHHLENPVHFQKEIKVTIEHGHANHLRNEMSSVAYWYADTPTPVLLPPPVAQRQPVRRDVQGNWITEEAKQTPVRDVPLNDEMRAMKEKKQPGT